MREEKLAEDYHYGEGVKIVKKKSLSFADVMGGNHSEEGVYWMQIVMGIQ